jgi:DNA-binding transcriptional LysR family regulator
MKFTAIKAFVAAVESGSLRNAARLLDISQPAITKLIKELEADVQASLLTRTSTGVSLTPQGLILFEKARKITRDLSVVKDEILQFNGLMRGDLTIAAVPLAVMMLIPEAVRTFSKQYPDINLRISEELYFEQLERLRRGEVQIGIGGIPKGIPSGEFVIEPLIKTRMVVVAKHGSAFLKAKSLKDLIDAKWVYTGSSKEEGYAKQLFEKFHLGQPKVGAVVNSTLALLSLIVSSDFIGLMPIQIASSPMAKQFFSVIPVKEEGLDLEVGAIVRSDMNVSSAVSQFINHLHRSAAQLKHISDN